MTTRTADRAARLHLWQAWHTPPPRMHQAHPSLTAPAADSEPALPQVAPVYHRREIAGTLRRLCDDSIRWWNAMPAAEFIAPIGDGWSPADHVRHLTKSMRAVERALRLPKWLLRLLFGRGRGVSRQYDVLVERYRASLAAGGTAGRYAPSPERVTGDPEAYRTAVLGAHRAAVHDLAALTLPWKVSPLDRVRLPHPLLGRLTVREMLMFTVYHNLHHVLVVARKRG